MWATPSTMPLGGFISNVPQEPSHKMQPEMSGRKNAVHLCTHEGCTRQFDKFSQLRAHSKSHVGSKPYVCNWTGCSWRFARSDDYHRHYRRHTGDRPYKCAVCPKAFPRSDHLSLHMKTHARSV